MRFVTTFDPFPKTNFHDCPTLEVKIPREQFIFGTTCHRIALELAALSFQCSSIYCCRFHSNKCDRIGDHHDECHCRPSSWNSRPLSDNPRHIGSTKQHTVAFTSIMRHILKGLKEYMYIHQRHCNSPRVDGRNITQDPKITMDKTADTITAKTRKLTFSTCCLCVCARARSHPAAKSPSSIPAENLLGAINALVTFIYSSIKIKRLMIVSYAVLCLSCQVSQQDRHLSQLWSFPS